MKKKNDIISTPISGLPDEVLTKDVFRIGGYFGITLNLIGQKKNKNFSDILSRGK